MVFSPAIEKDIEIPDFTIAPEVIHNSEELNISKCLTYEDYAEIEEEMDKKFGYSWGFHNKKFDRSNYENETEYLIPGSLKLINNIIEAYNNGEKYDTIIFLDKSARPAAYLYRSLIKDLRNKEVISDNIEFPQIKFVDIGKTDDQGKFNILGTREMLADKMPVNKVFPRGEESRLLVVDEFKDTGATLSNAMTEIAKIYPDKNIDAAYMFAPKIAPFWYKDESAKLVKDVYLSKLSKNFLQKVYEDNEKNMTNRITAKDAFNVFKFIAKMPKNVAVSLLEERLAQLDRDDYKNCNKDILKRNPFENVPKGNPKDLYKKLENLSKGTRLEDEIFKSRKEYYNYLEMLSRIFVPGSAEDVYDIFASAAGRFAASQPKNLKKAQELREKLKFLSEKVTDKIKEKIKV